MNKSALIVILITLLANHNSYAQIREGWWRVELFRIDSIAIPFNFESKLVNGKTNLFARNVSERIKIDQVSIRKDSVFIQMPVFESRFRGKLLKTGSVVGEWIRGSASQDVVLLFKATPGIQARFPVHNKPLANITGRWAVNFISNDTSERVAVAEFEQNANKLTGTFLTTTGDYRFLEGVVDGDSLLLSTFDGSHAYFFKARIVSAEEIEDGHYYAGAKGHQRWSARKNATAHLPKNASAVYLREGEERLHFSFPDLDGKKVSINDQRFKNKVVIIQIMGSWCSNCMDETKFLSDYYLKNKNRGVEVVSLAYEYSEDIERSKKSLLKFKERFNVQYPMLITGARTNDSLRTEKTLPEITLSKCSPLPSFLGRTEEFAGFILDDKPGTGEHYEAFKKILLER
jgi:thiol-disulfide isomerase/thioredoxin